MNSPFQPKKLNVPGLLGDDAINESLKQFAAAGNATQAAAPPPSSAVDMVDRIQREYLSKPAEYAKVGMRALSPVPIGPVMDAFGGGAAPQPAGPAPVDPQQRAVDVRSDILSDAAAAISGPLRDVVLGPVIGELGEGGTINALGTLATPEARQAEADQRAVDAKAVEATIRDKASVRAKLRGLTDEDAAAMGMPVPPGGTQPETAVLPSATAVPALKLTLQEQNLYQHHVDNIQNGKFVRNADGSISTLYQTSVDIDGKTYNFPTVWDGKILPPDEAVQRALKEKPLDQWPSYVDPAAAEARYGQMHQAIAPDVAALEAGLTQKEQNAAADQKTVAEAAKRNEEAIAATKDPALQPKQTWWLNAMQSGVKGFAGMGTGTASGLLEVGEMVRDATGLDLLTGGGRSNARAWVDTVDATLTKMLPGDKARSKDFVTQLSQGTGSMAGFLLAGYVGAAFGFPVKASTMIVGAATQGDQQFKDAEAFGASGVQKYMALIAGGALGLTEAIPIDRMFTRADAMTGGLVRRMLSHTVAGSMEEFVQEFGQAAGQDVVARLLYDEKRKFDLGSYFKQGVVGAITGGLVGAATTALHETGVSAQPAPPPVDTATKESMTQQLIDTLDQQLNELPDIKEHDAATAAEVPLANVVPPEPAAVTQVVQGPGGTIPVNANGQFEAHHESRQQLDVIDPSKRGTGPLRGGERKRLTGPDAVDRSYFGVGDPDYVRGKDQPYKLHTDPYHGEGLGPFRHAIEADPKTIYNWYEDPLKLKSQLDRSTPASEQVTRYEKLIKDAGFKGVYFSESPLGQVAAMFEPTKPSKVIDARYGLPPAEIATPQDFSVEKLTPETFSAKGGWAVVTATQEALGDANAPTNLAANEKLRAELKRKGVQFQEVGGTYQGTDQGKSFLVFMPEKAAVALGKKYKQESVLTRKGLEYSDGRLVPAVPGQTVIGDKAKANDFFSTLPDGQAFSVGLDFGAQGGTEAPGDILARVETPERVKQLTQQIPGLKGVLKHLAPDEQAKLKKQNAADIVKMFTELPDAKEMAAVAFAGRAKRGWYQRSAEALVNIFGLQDAPRFAGLLAALSPQTSVESNAINALTTWTNWTKAGRPTDEKSIRRILGQSVMGGKGEASVLPSWVNNTVTALSEPDALDIQLSGPKVDSFMKNLQGKVNEVTNDAWMANFANVDQTLFRKTGPAPGKGAGYIAMNAVVRKAADVATKMTGETWTPAEIQETVWSWAKTLYEKASAAGENRTAAEIVAAGGMTAEEIGATPDFASLFVSGVYRNILEKGGFDVDAIAAGSGKSDGADAGRSDPGSAEGSGFAQSDLNRYLGRAARRLDALRIRRQAAEQDTSVTTDETFFPEGDAVAARQGELDQLTADDHAFLDENLLANVPVRTDPLPLFPERSDQSFDRWFGDSVVTNPDGTPKAVFHGTPTKDGFRIFDPKKTGKTSVLFSVIDTHRNGFFFAENEEFAKTFADQGRQPGRVMPVFLSIQNPLDVTESLNVTVNALNEIGLRAQEIDPSITNPGFFADRAGRDDFWELLDTPEGGDVFVQAAKELGYDGIRMYEPNHDNRDSELVWVAFDNTQIKSADENTGAYSPTNPDIHASVAPRVTQNADLARPAGGVEGAAQAGELSDVNLAKIGRGFTKLMGSTVRQGRITAKGKVAGQSTKAIGQYDRKQDVIRTGKTGDVSTLVHEGGHDLYFNAGPNLQQFIAGNDTDLMKVADDLYGGDTNVMPKATHIAEGFAEFFRVYTLNRAYAENHYPTLTSAFDDVLVKDAPQLKTGLALVGQQYAAWMQMPSAQVVRNMIVSGQQAGPLNAALKELADAGFQTWMHEYARRAVDASVNRFASLNDLVSQTLNIAQDNAGKSLDLKRADDPRVLMRLASNTGARAMVEVTDGVMGHNSTVPMTRSLREAMLRYHGKNADQNLFSIDPVRQQDFAAYLVALRGIDEFRRLAEGKIARMPLGDKVHLAELSTTVKELEGQYGTDFSEAAKIVHEYAMGLWQKSFDAGLMSEETYQDGLDRQFYAPLQRDMSDKRASLGASALTGSAKLVKRFKGSDRNVVDPMDVLMHKTFALEKIVNRNEVFRTLAKLAERAGKAGAMVERIPATQLMGKQLSVAEAARALTKDEDVSAADAQDLMEILQASIENENVIDYFRSEPIHTKGENILFGWENGRLAALQLADGDLGADVVNVVNGLGRENLPLFTGIISASSTVFRAGIVSWPDFLAANFIKDQFSTFILTDVGYKPFVTGMRGMYDELRQQNWGRQYNAAMGSMGGMNVANLHDASIDRNIAALKGKGYLVKSFTGGGSTFTNALRGTARLTELSETGTRIGVFKSAYERAKKDGLTDWDASIEASYIAMDLMDFGLNGSRTAMARKTIPFLNAQLQGLYKMMRTLGADEVRQRKGLNFALRAYFKSTKNLDLSRTEKMAINTGRKAWVKMASLGLISAALHFLFRDDPDYQEAGEYLRTTGWVIPTGDGKLFFIPKPYELAIIANFTERALESSEGDTEALSRFRRGLAMTFLPPVSPPLITSLVEQYMNKDTFTGQEIVPSYMQALAPELQFNNYTSTLAKELGSALGWSPLKIDHFMSSLGATAYRDLMSMYNTSDPNRGTMKPEDVPLMRRFYRDAHRGSTTSQDFWRVASTLNGTLRQAEVTYKAFLDAGNEHAANEFLDTLDPDAKAYAILATDFKADAKRLNPFYRARQLSSITSAMRREMVSELGLGDTTTKTSDPFKLTAKEKSDLDTALSEYTQREMRNTLVVMGAPGWAGKAMVDTKTTLNLIGRIEPRALEELQRRIDKAKVYDFKTITGYWPEVKNRLLRDRENTFLDDILSVAKVMR